LKKCKINTSYGTHHLTCSDAIHVEQNSEIWRKRGENLKFKV